ncbi:MAG: helix-turn-helix domain-containing protein, partial [Pirellulaceae bacterium]
MPVTRTKLTPPELASRWGISPEKVVAWVRSGELRAIDASTRRGGRPRYLIDISDVEAFERRRAVAPPPPSSTRTHRKDDGIP